MRTFSFKPALVVKGRKYKGLRGFAGKPFHPPLTDLPVAGYVFAGLFDALSALRGSAPLRARRRRTASSPARSSASPPC